MSELGYKLTVEQHNRPKREWRMGPDEGFHRLKCIYETNITISRQHVLSGMMAAVAQRGRAIDVRNEQADTNIVHALVNYHAFGERTLMANSQQLGVHIYDSKRSRTQIEQ